MLCLLLLSCGRHTLITIRQPHIITRIDTIGRNLHITIQETGPGKSLYGIPLKVGDSLTVFMNKNIRIR